MVVYCMIYLSEPTEQKSNNQFTNLQIFTLLIILYFLNKFHKQIQFPKMYSLKKP